MYNVQKSIVVKVFWVFHIKFVLLQRLVILFSIIFFPPFAYTNICLNEDTILVNDTN